ncbi:hypothetical protein DIPPA_17090 [Diplonema papillatum]|nr:hypothetical protein DIPPA_17090 [Diplonema papillatum]
MGAFVLQGKSNPYPVFATVLLLLAVVHSVSACVESNDYLADLNADACYMVDSNHGELCSCPFYTCVRDENPYVGRCKLTDTGTYIIAGASIVAALVLLLCAWCLCCKGPSCTVTRLCGGGLLCRGSGGGDPEVPAVTAAAGGRPLGPTESATAASCGAEMMPVVPVPSSNGLEHLPRVPPSPPPPVLKP